MDRLRIFVAVDLSERARVEVGKVIEELRKKRWQVRWESEDKLHLTLFFVGWVEERRLQLIEKVLLEVAIGFEPFSIRLGRIGVFPDFVQPRVIWLGIRGDQAALVRLRKRVAKALVRSGYSDEERVWLPHLTIGRVKEESRFRGRKELGRQLEKMEIKELQEKSSIERIILYQSVLTPTGSVYRPLSEFPFNSFL